MKKLKIRDLWGYASGEGATSITMNGIGNFGMLFFTQIIGLNPALVGLALSIATLWDAITDPLMGTISDRTVSRYGNRHPYILIGGILLAFFFVMMWFVPESFEGERMIFAYMLVINIIIRTAFTVFLVPYMALGFEMCDSDMDRARLQGVRVAFNMVINIIFGGLGWILFFPDVETEEGVRIDGTRIAENYESMAIILGVVCIVLVLFCVFITYKFSNKNQIKPDPAPFKENVKAIIHDLKDVFSDKLVWLVFGFYGIAQFSMMVVSQVQMFTYVEYMLFTDIQKTFVHTGGMVGFMFGSLFLGSMVKRFDKKLTGYGAMVMASCGGLGLLVVFTGGLLDPQATIGTFPVAVAVFGFFQFLWWGSCGVLVPLATSMIGDLSRIKRAKTGEVTEGRYAAGFSFFMKAANALGLMVTGLILTGAGYESGLDRQSPETVNNLALMTFTVGPILMFISFFFLRRYPITHKTMLEYELMDTELNEKDELSGH